MDDRGREDPTKFTEKLTPLILHFEMFVACERNRAKQRRSQEFVSEGDKSVGSVNSGVHTGTEPRVGSGAKPPRNSKIC